MFGPVIASSASFPIADPLNGSSEARLSTTSLVVSVEFVFVCKWAYARSNAEPASPGFVDLHLDHLSTVDPLLFDNHFWQPYHRRSSNPSCFD